MLRLECNNCKETFSPYPFDEYPVQPHPKATVQSRIDWNKLHDSGKNIHPMITVPRMNQ
jgi:hypothetical protein